MAPKKQSSLSYNNSGREVFINGQQNNKAFNMPSKNQFEDPPLSGEIHSKNWGKITITVSNNSSISRRAALSVAPSAIKFISEELHTNNNELKIEVTKE